MYCTLFLSLHLIWHNFNMIDFGSSYGLISSKNVLSCYDLLVLSMRCRVDVDNNLSSTNCLFSTLLSVRIFYLFDFYHGFCLVLIITERFKSSGVIWTYFQNSCCLICIMYINKLYLCLERTSSSIDPQVNLTKGAWIELFRLK